MNQNFQIQFSHLGLVPYEKAFDEMMTLRESRLQNKIPDQILFLEHDPVITMGRINSTNDLNIDINYLKYNGINFLETDRGGRLTYHGPGQLIGYFIMDIGKRGISVDQLVKRTEEGLLRLLFQMDIEGERDQRNPGIWVGNNKIASLGFHIHRGVTTHGFALNVSCDLTPFSYFIPCGVEGAGVTSVLKETGKQESIKKVARLLQDIFVELWNDYP